jgi:hypothetical protein
MKRVFTFLIALMMLSLVACSDAPKEYVVSEPVTQEQPLFEEEQIEEVEEVSEPVEEASYIGNANSYKFHSLDCSSVDQMNESNKVFLESRQEAIDKGFEPCQRCNP